MGSARCAGVTHFSILFANFLAGALRLPTAVLEWNDHGDLERMEEICTGRRSKKKEYRVLDVVYVKNAGREELVSCMRKGFDRIIIDFGDRFAENQTEFLRCHRKIVLLAFSEWQMSRCLEFAGLVRREREKGWEYCAVFGSEETRSEVIRKLRLPVRRIPFSADAFTVTRESMAFFRSFEEI